MELLSRKLTTYLICKNVISEGKRTIYQYGFQIGLEVSLNTIVSIFIAVIYHMEIEALVFFLVFIPLRSYAGGLHLDKYISCLICSCLSLLFLLLIAKYIKIDNLLSLGIIAISLISIKLFSPVKDINRPISQSELIMFGKKLNCCILMIGIMSIIFYCIKLNRMLFMVSITTLFMVIILLLGEIKYRKNVKKVKTTILEK
jgi:accessory gene regulator B